MTAKHSIGATVTACSQEKNPNEIPATLPNARCGNLAVPPVNPLSRFSPTSAGAVCGATDCVAMSNLLSVRARVRDTGLPTSWDHRIDLQSAWKVLKQHLF